MSLKIPNYSNTVQYNNRTSPVMCGSKQPVKTQENKTTTARKLGYTFAGILAGLSALVIAPKMIKRASLKECQKQFSEIFRREVSASETETLVKRYKELYKIDKPDEFIKKAFEQVKKDYGYENAKIDCSIHFYSLKSLFEQLTRNKQLFRVGETRPINLEMCITVLGRKPEQKLKSVHKTHILNILFHEFKHLQQYEYCYHKDKNQLFKTFWNELIKAKVQPQDIEAFLKPFEHRTQRQNINIKTLLNESFLNKIFRRKNKPEERTLKERFNRYLDYTYTKAFENIPKKDLSKYDSIINKYFKSLKSYRTTENATSLKDYKNQFVETEAYSAGEFAKRMSNNWYHPLEFFKAKIPLGLGIASAGCFAKDWYDNLTHRA